MDIFKYEKSAYLVGKKREISAYLVYALAQKK